MIRSPRFLALVALVACATPHTPTPEVAALTTPPPAPAKATPAPDTVVSDLSLIDADAVLTAASGATFKVSKGWFMAKRDGYTLLQGPEKDLTLALFESTAPSADAAIADAWKRFRPDFAIPALQTVKPPARDPWEEVSQTVYDVPSKESRTVLAAAFRRGTTWYVGLIDGANAALERRGAQIGITIGSWMPAGGQEESLAGRKANPLDAARKAELTQFIEEWRPKAGVPGLAIAVVQDGKVVFEQGFGEREQGSGKKVTPDSLFLIGSASKSLTSLMMAKLVDEGRFSWDTKVKSIMPAFALGDASATERIEMRHTVCACTGLPRQDMEFLFQFAGITPEQRFAELAKMKPTTGFGETFQYSNSLVSAGGYVAAHAAEPKLSLDAAYFKALQARVLDPLKMKSTTFDFAVAAKRERAMPYGLDLQETAKPIPVDIELAVRSVAPAGGAWSSARDMAKYVAMELSGGMGPDGKRFVSEKNLLARREPQTRVSDKATYGLGLFAQQDRGLMIYSHGGNTLGFTAEMFFIPEAGVGGVVLMNAQVANALGGAIRNKLIEQWFGAKPVAATRLDASLKIRKEGVAKQMERVTLVPDAAWAKPLTGTWTNPALGELRIVGEGKAFTVDAGEWKSALGQKKDVDGTLSLILIDPPLAGLELVPRDRADKQVLELETPQQKYAFERAPERSASESSGQ